jgi:glucosamine-6-phosphate deaminase
LVAAHIINAVVAKAGAPVLLGCPAGRTPVTTYAALRPLAKARRVDLSNLQVVMLDEYVVDGELCELSAHYSCRRFSGRLYESSRFAHLPHDQRGEEAHEPRNSPRCDFQWS